MCEAWENGDVNNLWERGSHLSEVFLIEKAAIEASNKGILGDDRYYGRGRAADVTRVRVSPNQAADAGVQIDSERRELQRLNECIRELLVLLPSGSPQHVQKLWGKVTRLGQHVLPNQLFRHAWTVNAVPSEHALGELSTAVREILRRVTYGDRERFIRTTRRRIQ